MGILNDAIKAFDPSAENYSAAQEILTTLTEAAETKADMLLNKIYDSLRRGIVLGEKRGTESLCIPITHISKVEKQFRYIGPDTNNTEIPNHITNAITNMIDNTESMGLVNGVTKLIYADLEPILNVTDGQEKTCATATAFTKGCGVGIRITRFDCIISAKSVQENTLQNNVRTIVTGVVVKSTLEWVNSHSKVLFLHSS